MSCQVEERADNASSHVEGRVRAQMTLSLPGGGIQAAECLEVEALGLKKVIIIFTAGGGELV